MERETAGRSSIYHRGMPNMYFYSADGDHAFLLDLVFGGKHTFRVFESRSAVNEPLREFDSPSEVLEHWRVPQRHRGVALLAVGAAEAPTITRIDLHGNHRAGSFDFLCEGWGMIHLNVGAVHKGVLERSTVSHNSEARAIGWATNTPRLGSPSAWDWRVVNSAATWLGRQVRNGAVLTQGAHPVLPAAAVFLR